MQSVVSWLQTAFQQRNIVATIYEAGIRDEGKWFHVPVYVPIQDAYDKATLLQEIEDAWEQQHPIPGRSLLLIPASPSLPIYEFDADKDDILELNAQHLADDNHVIAIVIPETQGSRFDPWEPGKPVSFFGPDEMLVATSNHPQAEFRVPSPGRWLAQLDDRKSYIVRRDKQGGIHRADQIVESSKFARRPSVKQ